MSLVSCLPSNAVRMAVWFWTIAIWRSSATCKVCTNTHKWTTSCIWCIRQSQRLRILRSTKISRLCICRITSLRRSKTLKFCSSFKVCFCTITCSQKSKISHSPNSKSLIWVATSSPKLKNSKIYSSWRAYALAIILWRIMRHWSTWKIAVQHSQTSIWAKIRLMVTKNFVSSF